MELSAIKNKAVPARPGRSPVKWRHSMYFRVLVLCCVLLLCLFASIFIIVRHTIGEAIREVESESFQIAEKVYKLLEKDPSLEREEIAGIIMREEEDTRIFIEPRRGLMPEQRTSMEYRNDGTIQRVVEVPLERLDMFMTIHFSTPA